MQQIDSPAFGWARRSRRRRTWRAPVLAVGACLAFAACGSGAPSSAPSNPAVVAPTSAPASAPASLAGIWEGNLVDPTGSYAVRMAFDGCTAGGPTCGEIEYLDPSQGDVVQCASELTPAGTVRDRLELTERLVYHEWLCLETTFSVRRAGDGSLEVEQYGEPGVVCCRGTLAPVADAQPVPTPGLATVPGLGHATAMTPLGGATTQAVASGAGSMWFPLEDLGGVARLDAASGAATAIIQTGDPSALSGLRADPHGVAAGDAGIWVGQAAARSVGRIDPATGSVSESIPVPVVPYALALDGMTLWLTSFDDDQVLHLDLSTGKVIASIAVTKPGGIAVGLGGVWVVKHRDDAVVRIDPTTNAVVAEIRLGEHGPSDVCGMCVENVVVSDGSVWTANNEGRSVSRIDPATNEVAATIELPLRSWAVSAGGGAIWASQFEGLPDGGFADESTWGVVRIDPATNIASFFALPGALGVTWGGEALWVVTPGRRGDTVIRLELDRP